MRDHSECAETIDRLMGRERFGEAAYVEARCVKRHQTATPAPKPEPLPLTTDADRLREPTHEEIPMPHAATSQEGGK